MSFADEYAKARKKRFDAPKVTTTTDDDFAPVAANPVKLTEQEQKSGGWFKSGAFDDGYDFGDLTKSALSTTGDLGVNALKGVVGLVEGVSDLIVYGLAAAEDLKGNSKSSRQLKKSAQENKTDKIFEGLENAVDENSFFGDKMDSVSQGIGQVAAIIATGGIAASAGASTMGASAITTGVIGASSMGSGIGEAYEGGATDGEAFAYGAIKGTVDAGTELLFGGLGKTVKAVGLSKGVSSLDDVFAKKLSSKISNQTAKTLTEFGVKASAEGFEEVLAGAGSAVGKKLTYMSEEELSQLVKDEKLLDQFVVGAVTSGIMQSGYLPKTKSGSLRESLETGRDFIDGLTTNEQTVLDKVVEERIAEAEKDGKELSKKEKNEIYNQVQEELKKGYISTDTIESVLGGDTYKSYKDTVDSEEAILKEYEELGNKTNSTLKEQARYAELQAQVKEINENSQRSQLKSQLSKEVYEQLTREIQKGKKTVTQTDNYLLESYNEQKRRGQVFEADVSKYNEKQATIIQKAIDSGILNNTNRTHEFVDMIAKISADKGVLFDFSNNEKIKNSGFAVDGKTVNGFVTKNGITLNIQSSKALNTVVGHEVTHVLEGTELYSALQEAVIEYAKAKGEYDSRYKALEEVYKNVKDADINAELTADLVGDYLFTDQDFINNLSTKNRNVFQKIYDEIKYLLKVATAGSKEARELEKVKRAFDKAYKESGNATADTKYSLTEVEAVQPKSNKWSRGATTDEVRQAHPTLYAVDETATEERNPTQVKGTVGSYRKVYESLKNEGFDGTILDASSGLGYGTKAGIEEYGFDVEDIEPYPDKEYKPKYTDYSTLDKKYDVVISNAVLNVLPQDQRDALVVKMGELLNDGGRMFINVRGKDVLNATGKIAINEANMEYFIPRTAKTGSYQKGFTKQELKSYLEDALGEGYSVNLTNMFGAVSAVVTKESNTKYSLSDSDGKTLTKEQSEYFKDSKMRDDNGNLMVMYHGSQDAGFHVFDASMSDDGTSFFFVDRNDVAASYSGTSETYEAQTIHTSEDMNKFIESIGAEGYEVVEKDGKFTLLYENERVADSDTAQGIYNEFCWYEGVGEGDANYKVYLNLKNPLVVDAEGRNWNNISREFSQEIADRYNSLTEEEKAALSNLAEWGEYSIFKDEMLDARAAAEQGVSSGYGDAAFTKTLARAYTKLGGANANLYDAFSIAQENFSEESIKEFAVKQMNTRDYAKRAKEQGYDGVIFKNIHDNGGYSNGSEGASTVAIAFESNQIKSVANEKPTGNADIRYSLSEDSEGRKLSDEQSAYFNGSKVVDDNGNLKAVYHGSPADFNTFSLKYLGTNGTNEGYGFYFTDKKSIAEGYTKGLEGQRNEQHNGKLFEVYLDIKKPLSDTEVTMSRAEFKEFLIELNNQVDEDGEPLEFLSNYGDVSWEGLNKVLNYAMQIEYDGSDNDVNLVHSIINACGDKELVFEVLRKTTGYDGIIVNEATWGGDQTIYIAFHPEQIKNVDNKNPTTNPDIRYSLSAEGEAPKQYGNYNVSGKDIALEAPMQEDIAKNATPTEETSGTVSEMEQVEDFAPISEDEVNAMQSENLSSLDDTDAPPETEAPYYDDIPDTAPLEEANVTAIAEDVQSILGFDKAEMPKMREIIQKYATSETPNYEALYKDVKENFGTFTELVGEDDLLPEIKKTIRSYRFKQSDMIKGEMAYLNDGKYGDFRKRYFGKILLTKDGQSIDTIYAELNELYPGHFPSDIYNAADQLNRIVEVVDSEGEDYTEYEIDDETIREVTDDIIRKINNARTIEAESFAEEERKALFEHADGFAPMAEDFAPIAENKEAPTYETRKASQVNGQLTMFAEEQTAEETREIIDSILSEPVDEEATATRENKTAQILTEEPETAKKKNDLWSKFKRNFVDKGAVFEDLSLKTNNRELMSKWNYTLYSEAKAQRLMGNGTEGVKSLNDIRAEVEESGRTKDFYEYLYHKHNVDRMSLESKAKPTIEALKGKFGHLKIAQVRAIAAHKITEKTTEKTAQTVREAKAYLNAIETKNKPVFSYDVTAEQSQKIVEQYEASNPEFKEFANDVYTYMNYLRGQMVESGVISQETADLWAKMYPHYVPIRRLGDSGLAVNVPLDTGKTGINAPIKGAKGGNRDILPLFDTMALRTEQTYRAIARNNFGVELKNTLGTTIESAESNLDEMIDSVENHEELLQKGENGKNPTFTVFENGGRVTFEITEDMYEALKPTSEGLKTTVKPLNTASRLQRGILTEYNPIFMATNAIKDVQDILINSQHAAQTYKNLPKAIKELSTKGKWYTEYMENGGEQNTYFDGQTNTFKAEDKGFVKAIGMPLRAIKAANNFVERAPRLAEYIASREAGASIETAMLDAARVTTNFAAGGDVTKFIDRNGATFLNASVQGFNQQVRNIKEAKANGLKGWVGLATKFAIAGLPAILLNNLLWNDDEEYEELSDYVKDNYYVVAKYGDGQFVRIPKGRTVAVIQSAFEQVSNSATGDDEADFNSFFELFVNNLAPNNPLENNVIAPISQAIQNKTWYGEDLVPTRLQDMPAEEQYDESTDSLSKWLGEKTGLSPYKINYVLDQYSGGIGDVVLPYLTPEADGGGILAPISDKFTTDSTMKNQNVTDFYTTKDELTANANSSKATTEDILKSKYINSVSAEMSELYKEKREIQNSDMSDDEKREAVRDIQRQIDELAKEALNSYNDMTIYNGFATVGDKLYKRNSDGTWEKISEKQREKQEEVTEELGIDPATYWGNKSEYDFAYEYPEKYAVAKSVGGYEAYKTYSSELYDIKADKDENGKSISGSRKEKVIEYINGLDADYGEKIILFKSEYNADDTYNQDILDYLNSRDNLTYEEIVAILKELGFTIGADGTTVTW